MYGHAKKLIVLGVASVGERNAQIWFYTAEGE